MIYTVRHRSTYAYRQLVDLSFHVLHMSPRVLPSQEVFDVRIITDPPTDDRTTSLDYFGNDVIHLSLARPHDWLVVDMTAMVRVDKRPQPDPATSPAWEDVRDGFAREFPDEIEGVEFVHASPLVPILDEVVAFAAPSFTPRRPLVEAVLDLTHRIRRDFVFDGSATAVTTPLAEVMERRRGVCQDFAHLEIASLRAMGLSARYVSGYIRTYAPDGQTRQVGVDGSHAWVSVFCPGTGWIDVDPTNDLLVSDEHIVLAWGRDYDDVSPIRGVILGGGDHKPLVGVDVTPIE